MDTAIKRTIGLGVAGAAVGGAMEAAKASQNFKGNAEIAQRAAIGAAIWGGALAVPYALLSFIGKRLQPASTPGAPLSDAEKKVVNLRLKMAEIAKKALWRTMGRPGDVPWWFKDARIAQDRDGNYFLKGIISDKLPMDDTGWPYGLPHTSEGVKVVAERENPSSVEPVKLGPI